VGTRDGLVTAFAQLRGIAAEIDPQWRNGMTRKHTHIQVLAAATVLACSLGLVSLVPTTAAAKSCVMAGGEATMITLDLAKFMAEAALKNSMKDRGMSPAGPVKMRCEDPSPLTHCMAKQRACK
jgi:hypothetical protein